MTYEEYLAFDAASETKHEYVNGEVYAMSGSTPEHARLQSRLSRLLGNALEGKPCEVYSSDLRILIEATGRATYPDVTVVCGQLQTQRMIPMA
jgi:Uma2 family endonuclease